MLNCAEKWERYDKIMEVFFVYNLVQFLFMYVLTQQANEIGKVIPLQAFTGP
jgi:hypothetical protein